MATLIVNMGNEYIGSFTIPENKITTIGRHPKCDVIIEGVAVSSLHATISRINNDYVIEDKESTNGTIIGGKSIRKKTLEEGMEIQIGKYRLKFWSKISSGIEAPNASPKKVSKP